jgi:hypothetical protein
VGRATHATRPFVDDTGGVRNQDLLPIFATAIAIEIIHLRWIMLMKWTCRGCHVAHMQCDCKYGWLKRLL